MPIKHLLLFLCCTLLVDAQVYRNYSTAEGGSKTTPITRKRTVVQTHYNDGALQSETEYHDGRLDGLSREYYKNGVLKAEIPFRNGREDGEARFFYPSGILKQIVTFERGKPVETVTYDESGKRTSVQNHRNSPPQNRTKSSNKSSR